MAKNASTSAKYGSRLSGNSGGRYSYGYSRGSSPRRCFNCGSTSQMRIDCNITPAEVERRLWDQRHRDYTPERRSSDHCKKSCDRCRYSSHRSASKERAKSPRQSDSRRKQCSNRQLAAMSSGRELYLLAKFDNGSDVEFEALLDSGSSISVISYYFFKNVGPA